MKPLSGHENLDEKVIESLFLNFLGNVSFSYSAISNPSDKFIAVSTLSANLLPKFEFNITLSTIIEMSCFIFLLNLEIHQYLNIFH